MADGDALHIARTKASSAVGLSEDTKKQTPLETCFLVCSFSAFHKRLTSDDEAVRLAAAQAWAIWEGGTSYLRIPGDYVTSHGDPRFALPFARIENHYFVNKGFFDADDQLLRDAHKIADIPGVIVHGRYDVVCPVQNAFDLHKAWPKSELHVSPLSGHSAFEAENIDALVRATDRFAPHAM